MSEDRLRDAEDVLREALRVLPSASLLGRVQADLASARPEPRAPWLAAAAVILVLGSALLASLGRPRLETVSPPAPAVKGEASGPAARMEGIVPAPATRPRRVASRGVPPAEVLIASGQLEALSRLAERARLKGGTAPVAFAIVREADAGLGVSEPLKVEPLIIAPLAALAPPDLAPGARGGP